MEVKIIPLFGRLGGREDRGRRLSLRVLHTIYIEMKFIKRILFLQSLYPYLLGWEFASGLFFELGMPLRMLAMNGNGDQANNLNPYPISANGSLSKIEVFIISRIVALRQLGWSIARIADALGVDEEFVETAVQAYTQLSR